MTRQLPGASGYVLTFYPAWRDFPSDDEVRDTRRVNEFIEQRAPLADGAIGKRVRCGGGA